MSYLKALENYVKNIIVDLGFEIENIVLEKSSRADLGEYQINSCMMIAKKYGKNPREIAELIVSKFDDRFENVNIAGPGFINITLNKKYLVNYFNEDINNIDRFIDKDRPKKIIVDYGGANAAKALHVGHMRPANIGEALKRIAKVLGNDVIGDVHLGDLGRQSGMIISEIKLRKPDLIYFDGKKHDTYPKLEITKEELAEYYPAASIRAKESEEVLEEVRNITALVDNKVEPYFGMWKDIVEVSKNEIKKTYDYLDCNFELWNGELGALTYVPNVLEIMKPYMYESNGALVIDVKKEEDNKEIPPLIVVKTDGSTIYATRDLATLYERINNYNPDEIWYVVDERQSLYFNQVFRAAYKTKVVPEKCKLSHFGFGTMNGKDGKPFKTRDGNLLSLDDLINEVKQELRKKLTKFDDDKEKEEILDILTVATIKFADLSPYRTTDYIFDIEKFSSFEGKTGPYILYTMVRINSILKKCNINDNKIYDIYSIEEKNIYNKVLELTKMLNKSFEEKTTNYVCDYLYELCSLFNKFYGMHNIINETDNEKKITYISLLKLIYNVSSLLMNILSMKVPSQM